MIEMNKNTSPDKKSLKARESNAAKFLCVVLALITVFVSIVCVAVHSNNKKLIAAQTSAAGGDTVPSAKPVDATQNNNSVKPVEKTTEPVSVTERWRLEVPVVSCVILMLITCGCRMKRE